MPIRRRPRAAARHAARRTSATSARRARFEPLESRRLLAIDFDLVDINPTVEPGFASLSGFLDVDGVAYFSANDGVHGSELWRSDGTSDGTWLVKDVLPGENHSSPGNLFAAGGLVYFRAGDLEHGHELWTTDGTPEGTTLLKDLRPGPLSGSPGSFVEVDGLVYFLATSGSQNNLWVTDGTAAGTTLVRDVGPSAANYPTGGFSQLREFDGQLYFFARTATQNGLWKSDGTAAGTVLVRDFTPGFGQPQLSDPPFREATILGDHLYFVVATPFNPQLWKSDGTTEGTVVVATSEFPSSFQQLTPMGANLFFTGPGSDGLYKYDTLAQAVSLVSEVNPGASTTANIWYLTAVDGRLFFVASHVTYGRELWTSDGTTEGTTLVKDIRPGVTLSSSVTGLTNIGGTLHFFASDAEHDGELWRTDGTPEGTVVVADIHPTGSAVQSYFTNANIGDIGGVAFFMADDGVTGSELWKTTPAGGVEFVKDIARPPGSSEPDDLVRVGDYVYFRADDGVHGVELWRSDGTVGGTVLVADLRPGADSGFPNSLAAVGDELYFTAANDATGRHLYRVSGAGTPTLIKEFELPIELTAKFFVVAGDTVFFVLKDDELWRTDGTDEGTVLLREIAPGAAISDPFGLNSLGGVLYFGANLDNDDDFELWRSDGTEDGTTLVKTIPSATGDLTPEFAVSGGALYFRTAGHDLWRSDGTTAGTTLVKSFDAIDGRINNVTPYLVSVGGVLYFSASLTGEELALWKSDGTAAGTVRVQGTGANQYVASPVNLTDFNGTLFFTGRTTATGSELWKSNGTAAGTVLVKDVNPGNDGGAGQNLAVIDGVLYFGGSSAAGKQELWQSDGTTAGTTFVFDFTRVLDPIYPREITGLGDKLLLVADTALAGEELWVAQLPPLTGDYDGNRRVDGNDFLLWQRQLGQPVATPGDVPDGDASGTVDAGDLAVWRDHFGKPASAVAAAAVLAETEELNLLVPSPRRGGSTEHGRPEVARARVVPFAQQSGKGEAPATGTQNTQAADAVFSSGDFTSLFNATTSSTTRPRYRPRPRV